jgi:hypothetical protein
MAGYSKKSLVTKLGIKPGTRIHFAKPPPNYDRTLGELPAAVEIADKLDDSLDFVQFFTQERTELEAEFPVLKQAIAYDGSLWISWPKKASKVKTDLNENIVREVGLANGLVDVKVCAVDEIWSGLKFVYRVKDRK